MSDFRADLMARAAISRIDHGDELTWQAVVERIDGYGKRMSKRELELVVGYLAASILTRSQP